MTRGLAAFAAVIALALVASSAAGAAKMRQNRPTAAAPAPERHVAIPRPPATQTVTYGDHVLGADPDPHIRAQLLRDLGPAFGPND